MYVSFSWPVLLSKAPIFLLALQIHFLYCLLYLCFVYCPLLWHMLPGSGLLLFFSFYRGRIWVQWTFFTFWALLLIKSGIKSIFIRKMGNFIDAKIIKEKCSKFSKDLRIWLKLRILVTELKKISLIWLLIIFIDFCCF